MLRKLAFVGTLILLVVVLGGFVAAVQSQATELPPLTEPGPYGVRRMSMDFSIPAAKTGRCKPSSGIQRTRRCDPLEVGARYCAMPRQTERRAVPADHLFTWVGGDQCRIVLCNRIPGVTGLCCGGAATP